jgi:outer membrane protein OmpA-like peptidoglycan-associated protein/tetratricopeptide (TPR) repeat protein
MVLHKLFSSSLVAFLLFSTTLLFAQDKASLLHNADAFFAKKKYTAAIDLYEQVIALEATNTKAIYRAAICYLEVGILENAIEYLENVKQANDSTFKDFGFWYAKAAYYNQQFDTAQVYLKKTSFTHGKEAMLLLQNINNALHIQKNRKDYVVENLQEPINSNKAEFATLVGRDKKTLIFTRNKHEAKVYEDTGNANAEYEIVQSVLKNDNTWTEPTPITALENNKITTLQLTEDDHKLYLQQEGDLFFSDKVNGDWTKPAYLEGHIKQSVQKEQGCFVYEYGKKMILVSNLNTKNGDFDLFEVALRRDGTWGTPQPLTLLNSGEDETTPFVAEDGKTLYFSSKGHENIGGFDVFKAVYDEQTQTWGKPENMGMPINSVSDDTYFSLYDDMGYLVSQRTGGKGREDIYKVYLFSKVKLVGKVFNREAKTVIANSKIRFTADNLLLETTTNANGEYEVLVPFKNALQIKVLLQNKVVYEEHIELHIQHKKIHTISRNFYVDLDEKKKISLNSNDKEQIHLFGIVTEAKTLQPLLLPLQLADTLSSELKATSSDQNGYYSLYFVPNKGKYLVQLHKKGYLYFSKTLKAEQLASAELEVNIELKKIETGAKFSLHHIFFDTGSDVLKATSFGELDRLFFFLKENPEIKVEISGHTDNIGNAQKNLLLSENRAKSVMLYLINKGIAKKRLTFKGFGDKQPIASNDDEIDGRELNRRIEILVLPN